jgi:starch phosphorylase
MHAGGLGVLEGNKLYAAAVLGLRHITLSLYYDQGYVSYGFDSNGNPIHKPQSQHKEFIKSLRSEGVFKIKLRNEDVSVEALS